MHLTSHPLLVDTNCILECHRTLSWNALCARYRTETVEVCVMETQTGFQMRKPEERIDERELRSRLAAVHPVSDDALAGAVVREPMIGALDVGEQNLWAHALTREDAWILCGPDSASMRIGVRLGLRDRLVSLERLLTEIGHRANPALRRAYSETWLAEKLNQFVVAEFGASR
jgi:hypothetical protein